ncbi:hypothetical protein C1645_835225 [Glomus cerebriforme]|uniref:Crinkler effector protein N-terminal domain-containing protein n=1 Tax=Glomus cerebriforme TaxID=658196 RepID=A0A397S991_9GLOM|nr:hypothetical protein C1645_835225 [Glomus cerebriforme]
MKISVNCIFLGITTLSNSFTVPFCDKNNINGNYVNFDKLKIGDLKSIIWNRKKGMLKIDDPDNLKLWKVACKNNLKDIITEEQIKNKGKELLPINYFTKYFLIKLQLTKVSSSYKCPPPLNNPHIRIMPAWTWEEIEYCRHMIFSHLKKKAVWQLYLKWGGIPRYVLQNAQNNLMQLKLQQAIDICDERIFQCIGN